ncbi:hypothetical protein F66182_1371 [Fusarium sp. NRRL 66182]|nr:hypothetical protein F66182_1371 [Fusarium sp. NRRL 66182]
MPSITTMITSLAFAATVAALPANIARQECAKGTSFYTCGVVKGCFSYDPCVGAPAPVAAETPDCVANNEATTTTTATAAATTTTSSEATITPEAIYDIFPKSPSTAKDPVMGVHLEAYNNASQVEQAIVFKNIPAGAKECSFGWIQGPRLEQTFLVKNSNALAEIRQLSGFPAKDVSHNSIKPFDNVEPHIGAPDFSFWDDREHDWHGAGSVDCAETLYFFAGLRDPNSDSQVYLGQDHQSGWAIKYTL